MARADKIGMRYGRLLVISVDEEKSYHDERSRKYYKCKCDCGSEVSIRSDSLNGKHTMSCGCLQREKVSELLKKQQAQKFYYNDSRDRLHNIWYLMKYRCESEQSHAYQNYGGRGIKVCDEWANGHDGFVAFKKWAIENGYKDNLSIDRINNDGNYEPSNCKWSSSVEQGNNKRNNRYFFVDGVTKTLSQLSREYDMPMKTIHSRLAHGWSIIDALATPIRKSANNSH